MIPLLIALILVGLFFYYKMDMFVYIFEEVSRHFQVKYCAHEYPREVNSDGYQFCSKCNKARLVGLPDCQHVWETLEKYKVTDSISKAVVQHVYVQKCTKCGKMNNHET